MAQHLRRNTVKVIRCRNKLLTIDQKQDIQQQTDRIAKVRNVPNKCKNSAKKIAKN